MRRNKWYKILSLLLAVILLIGAVPVTAEISYPEEEIKITSNSEIMTIGYPAGLPDNMKMENSGNNYVLKALKATGYNVDQQIADGNLYTTCGSNAERYNSPTLKSYSSVATGFETLSAIISKGGFCCASFVTWFELNYYPSASSNHNRDFMKTGTIATNPQSVVSWYDTLNALAGVPGYSVGVAGQHNIHGYGSGTTFTNNGITATLVSVDTTVKYNDTGRPSNLVPGDLIIFGRSDSSGNWLTHIAIFAGRYNNHDYLIHVGNDRGPEISRKDFIGQAQDKSGYPIAYYHLPQNGSITVHKVDKDTKVSLAGAKFRVVDHNGTVVAGPKTTDSTGIVTFDGLPMDPMFGVDYYVQEMEAPAGYEIDSSLPIFYGYHSWQVNLTNDDSHCTNCVYKIDPWNNVRRVYGNIKFTKVDRTTKKAIANGGWFSVRDTHGNQVKDKNGTLLTGKPTDSNGEVQFNDLPIDPVNGTTYYVFEFEPPPNCIIDTSLPSMIADGKLNYYWQVTLTKNNAGQTVTFGPWNNGGYVDIPYSKKIYGAPFTENGIKYGERYTVRYVLYRETEHMSSASEAFRKIRSAGFCCRSPHISARSPDPRCIPAPHR